MRTTLPLATLVALSACSIEFGGECEPAARTFQDPTKFIAVDKQTFEHLEREAPAGLTLDAETVIENDYGDVVVLPVTPDQVPRLSELAHHATGRCGGFTAHSDLANAIERASEVREPVIASATLDYTLDNAAVAQVLIAEPAGANLVMTIESLSAFNNRHHASPTGAEASRWLRDYWTEIAGSRADIAVEQVAHTSSPQQSVMLTITGQTLPGEVVILGAHLDSLAGGQNDRAPGADDDASGVAVLTEIARTVVATRFRPNRTIKLIAYAAEEVGLRGSDEIAASFAANQTDVAAVMQLDMVNYNGSATDITFIRDRTSDALTNFTADIVSTYLPELSTANGTCGYACSDHASWDARGYPTVYPFEAPFQQSNPSIHTNGDTLVVSQNSAAHALKFTRLAAGFVAEAAKGSIDEDMEPPTDPDPPTPPDPGGDNGTPGGC